MSKPYTTPANIPILVAILAMLVLTAAAYWPGLSGSYLFDDFPNIVDNDAVHVTDLGWQDWKRAAGASPAHGLPRPLAMLSYAANHYFTGLDPRPMKMTNLLIHLVNGVLLYAVLLTLLGLWNQHRQHPLQNTTIVRTALGLACAWLLCPINLSSVLYVVQRMESLAQTFVLAGLLLYLCGRRRMLAGDSGAAQCAIGLAFGTIIGSLCKETAVLLPLYALLIELTVLRFAAATPDGPRRLWIIFAVLLFVPGIIGVARLLPASISHEAYAGRAFTLPQRLFTELRVVVDYMQWTLFPRPDTLGFYHDDIALSRGWLSPPSTLASGLLITTMLLSAVLLRRRLPLYALGISWFFAAHLLTATIIALELVFEHRNYFASIGLLLAASALLLEIPATLGLVQRALAVLAVGVFCAVTTVRAIEWGNPVRFAYAEAAEHPSSPRASYELGRTLVVVSGYRSDSKLIDPAMRAFEHAAKLPDSDAAAPAGLIIVANHMHREIRPEWWQLLTQKLSRQAPSQEDIGALQSLADCQRKSECAAETQQLFTAFLAALNHPLPNARLLATYGAFAANQLEDYSLAADTLSDAITISPGTIGYRIELAKVLLLGGKPTQAMQVLDKLNLTTLDSIEFRQVDDLKRQIEGEPAPAGKS